MADKVNADMYVNMCVNEFMLMSTGMFRYGLGARHSPSQPLDEICQDLHCHRDKYTWTSHPALEGTICSNNKVSMLGV